MVGRGRTIDKKTGHKGFNVLFHGPTKVSKDFLLVIPAASAAEFIEVIVDSLFRDPDSQGIHIVNPCLCQPTDLGIIRHRATFTLELRKSKS